MDKVNINNFVIHIKGVVYRLNTCVTIFTVITNFPISSLPVLVADGRMLPSQTALVSNDRVIFFRITILTDSLNCGSRMHREYRGRFPTNDFKGNRGLAIQATQQTPIKPETWRQYNCLSFGIFAWQYYFAVAVWGLSFISSLPRHIMIDIQDSSMKLTKMKVWDIL